MITFDYNPDTKECVLLKQEQVKEKAQKASTKAEEAEDSAEPQITLESNKYVLNRAAASLMGVEWENRLDIKYQPIEKGGLMFPIIGTDTAWKTKSGNKLTKSLTVSCRGNANDLLSKYGDTFTVTPWKGHDGLFVLIGNKDRSEEEIKDYTDYLDTILAENSKVKILTEELSISLFLYLQDKKVELYVPDNIYKQIEKLSLNSQKEDTKYINIYKYEE